MVARMTLMPSKSWERFALLAPGILGAIVIVWATTRGAGVWIDSATYVCAARTLIDHGSIETGCSENGMLRPMTHFPPVYPLMLATPSLIGLEPMRAARWINVVCMAINLTLIGLLLYAVTTNLFLAVLGELLFFSSFAVVRAHLFTSSDAPFTVFLIIFIFAAWRCMEQGGWRWIAVAAGAAAAACLTRYEGVPLLFTGAVALAWYGNRPVWERIRGTALFLFIATTPFVAWMIRNHVEAGSIAHRHLAWHPPGVANFDLAAEIVASWVLPFVSLAAQRLIGFPLLLAGIAVAALVAYRNPKPVLWLSAILILSICGFVLLARSMADIQIKFNGRILLPVFVTGIVFAFAGIHLATQKQRFSNTWRRVGIGASLLLVIGNTAAVVPPLLESHERGLGYRAWSDSPLIARVRALPPDTIIYSDVPEAIYLLTGKFPLLLPRAIDPDSHLATENLPEQIRAMHRRLEHHPGVIVYFHASGSPRRYSSLPELASMPAVYQLTTRVEYSGGDGAIYIVVPESASRPPPSP